MTVLQLFLLFLWTIHLSVVEDPTEWKQNHGDLSCHSWSTNLMFMKTYKDRLMLLVPLCLLETLLVQFFPVRLQLPLSASFPGCPIQRHHQTPWLGFKPNSQQPSIKDRVGIYRCPISSPLGWDNSEACFLHLLGFATGLSCNWPQR